MRPTSVSDPAASRAKLPTGILTSAEGNVWGYRDDCTRAGVQRSLFQTLLFMHRGGVAMALPGPDIVSKALGLLFTYVGGVLVGRLLLGYADSYPEYYYPKSR